MSEAGNFLLISEIIYFLRQQESKELHTTALEFMKISLFSLHFLYILSRSFCLLQLMSHVTGPSPVVLGIVGKTVSANIRGWVEIPFLDHSSSPIHN